MIFVLASCHAEFTARTPNLVSALNTDMSPLNVQFVDNANRLRGWTNVVILELDGWMKAEIPRHDRSRWQEIHYHIELMRNHGRISMWMKEWAFHRELKT